MTRSGGGLAKIDVNIQRSFRIDGKEYRTREEMPPGIRAAFEKSMAGKIGGYQSITPGERSAIVFNDIEYETLDEVRHTRPQSL